MRRISLAVVIVCVQLFSAPIQKYSSIGNLVLVNGDTLRNCVVGYRTFGKMNNEKSNAILFCTWYMGNSEDLQDYIGIGTFVDSTKYFVIAVDALSDGVSSSPSTSVEQPGTFFPTITIRDMVNSQFKMLKKEFGIAQLHGMIGGSMGGMQIFEWIVGYPDFMKKAVAYVGTPQLSSYNRLFFSLHTKIIELGKKYSMNDGDKTVLYNMAFDLVLRSPEYINKNIRYGEFDKYIASFQQDTISDVRFENLRRQLFAMIHHDISLRFNGEMDKAAKNVKAKLFLIVADNDLTVNPQPAIDFAQQTKAKLLRLQNDCGHLSPGCEFEKSSRLIQGFFAEE